MPQLNLQILSMTVFISECTKTRSLPVSKVPLPTLEGDGINVVPHCNDLGIHNSSHNVVVVVSDMPKQSYVAPKLSDYHDQAEHGEHHSGLFLPGASRL